MLICTVVIISDFNLFVFKFLPRETPKHVAFLINVNNKEFGCVRLSIVQYCIYICYNTQRDANIKLCS
jgi:hypothetical protein